MTYVQGCEGCEELLNCPRHGIQTEDEKMDEIKMTRKNAAKLIDQIRVILAANSYGRTHESSMKAIRKLFVTLPELEPCKGEAHSNPHINNCMACAPRWGYTGPAIKIT